ELTDEIGAQAEALKRQAEALQRALAEAKAEMGGGAAPGASIRMGGRRASDPDRAADSAPEQGDQTPGKPVGPALTVVGAAKAEEPGEEGEPVGTPAGARLLATQMAVSGSSRDEIEARLRNGFAIADTRSILDAILGPEK